MNLSKCEPEKKQFKPGFLSSLNRSFRIRSTIQAKNVDDQQRPESQPGNFRRAHSINVNRKHGMVKIPEMPLGSDLLKRVWNEGLDNVSSNSKDGDETSKPLSNEISTPRIDSYRFSMANLEDTQDVDLDAILLELTALELKWDEDIRRNSFPSVIAGGKLPQNDTTAVNQTNMLNSVPLLSLHRTDSPDNDSAFSDTVSMLSSESSTSSSLSAAKSHAMHLNLHHSKDNVNPAKAEKIRLALEKMKKASIKKLFIKAFSVDGSSKSLLVDEKMTCGYVTRLLAEKNHIAMDSKYVIIEYLPELHMERIFEDHEILVDNLMVWARDSKNKIYFSERPEKVAMFQMPEKYLTDFNKDSQKDYDEHSRSVLIEEFFTRTLPARNQPGVYITDNESNHSISHHEGSLYMKSDSKKGWKKYHFVIKSTGLYYYPKEKAKVKEMVSLASFAVNELFLGLNWKKKHKAPTDYCFALKHPRLQQPKCVKYIKFLCAEDKPSFDKWITAIRIAKHGRQLLDNYRNLTDELAQDDLDQLAHARSCSVISIVQNNVDATNPLLTSDNTELDLQKKMIYNDGSITGSSDLSSGRHSCTSSSSSSGCMSDGPSENETTAFDSEFSTGTIKRKPSMKPNIPLTSMTRQLKEMADSTIYSNPSNASDHSNNISGYTNTGTLTRRNNHRKSVQSSDDNNSGSGTLKRHKIKTNRGSIESMASQNSNERSTPSPSVTIRDSVFNTHKSCNGRQSPIKSLLKNVNDFYSIENSDVKPTTGVLMGYVTQQVVMPKNLSRQYLPDNLYETINKVESNLNKSIDSRDPKDDTRSELYMDLNYDNFNDAMSDETIENLPLPPPPNFTNEHKSNYDPMFSSTLSLESLPPPLPDLQYMISGFDMSASQLSLTNLPPPPDIQYMISGFDLSASQLSLPNLPPPPPLTEINGIENDGLRHNMLRDDSYQSIHQLRNPCDDILPKPKISYKPAENYLYSNQDVYSKQSDNLNTSQSSTSSMNSPTNATYNPQIIPNNFSVNNGTDVYSGVDYKTQQNYESSPIILRKAMQIENNASVDVKSPVVRRKQVSFNDANPTIIQSAPKKKIKNMSISLPVCDDAKNYQFTKFSAKPPPPRRSENTRLSSPKKLSDSMSNPPIDFLKDLQRVMKKKWQVAQKCKLEPTTTPHEVLGFREYPILSDDYKEANVSNWVQEHYGYTTHPGNFYENVNAKQGEKVNEYGTSLYSTPYGNMQKPNASRDSDMSAKKRPPPPIPKRSENTQLSAAIPQKPN